MEERGGEDNSPLLLVGVLAFAGIAAALFLAWRRRRPVVGHIRSGHSAHDEPLQAAEPPLSISTPIAAVAPAAVASSASAPRPWIELQLRPVRAGVGEDGARVEFELCVENKGSAPAEDVHIATFMVAAGSAEAFEMERALIDLPGEARLPTSIDPGDGKRIAASVALPREGLSDSILPVVVANARYRLPEGSEGRTSASFVVGVPLDGELAHFDVQNPSGLHAGVEARPHREPQKL
jgi:LPXTG-motif cell wall-anchored protein